MADPLPADDGRLIGAAREGDPAAFAELVARHGPRLFAFLLQTVRNRADTEDLCQTVWVAVHGHLHRYDADRPFRPWLFALAHRQAISAWRKTRPQEELRESDWVDVAHPAADACAREDAEALWAWIGSHLRAEQRDALWLMYREELAVKEIAQVLRCTSLRVRVMLHRARRKLLEHAGELAGAGWNVPSLAGKEWP